MSFKIKITAILLLSILVLTSAIPDRKLTTDEVPSKILKKFSKDHKDAKQVEYTLTKIDNIKVSFFNAKMRECWVYYTIDGKILQDVVKVPVSDIHSSIIPKIKAHQKNTDEKFKKKTIIASYAKIVIYNPKDIPTYYIQITDAYRTTSMEFSLDGIYKGNVLDDEEY